MELLEEHKHHIDVIGELMMRAELKGSEVEDFTNAFNWLHSISSGQLIVSPAPEYVDPEPENDD